MNDEEIPKHRKSRAKIKKPFTIEWKMTRPVFKSWGEWKKWKSYKTIEQRDDALFSLQGKHDDLFEYRKGETNEKVSLASKD